jgi:hypothetical protein
VGKIPANACPLGCRIVRGREWIRASAQVFYIVMYPVADRRHSRKAVLQFSKLMLRESNEHI